MDFALKTFLSFQWEEFGHQLIQLAPGFKGEAPGETLQQTPKTANPADTESQAGRYFLKAAQ